jgi:predicted amidohydrolase
VSETDSGSGEGAAGRGALGARSIAVAQTVPVRGDVAANLERHLRLIRAAAEEGPHVLVFPELSLTGYELDLAGTLAFSERDPRLDPLLEAAASSRAILVAGAPVRIGSRLHIGAFVLSPDGEVAIYTKRRLGAFPASVNPDGAVPPAEATVFHPGDRDPLVRLSGGRAAVAVCADTGDAEHPARAAARGATTYLASMFLIPSDHEKELPVLRSYAARHGMAVAMANFGGPSGGLPSGGGSAIWSGGGELLARLETAGAGYAVAVESDSGWRAKTVMLGDPR